MDNFLAYFRLGIDHITAFPGFDHILFIVVLMAACKFSDWKRILWVVTAFTVGHSLTLIAAGFKLIRINSELVEILIPFTILITALINVIFRNKKVNKSFYVTYVIVVFFGLIHGLGFSNFFSALVGRNQSILPQIVSFNLGIEVGQIIIVFIVLFAQVIIEKAFTFKGSEWNTYISGAGTGLSVKLILDAFLA